MSYWKRKRGSEKLKRMREAKARKRKPAPEGCAVPSWDPPKLRRTIIVIDYDFGRVEHRIDLYRSDRVDCYHAIADGRTWNKRIGWARVVEGLRKSFIRVGAE